MEHHNTRCQQLCSAQRLFNPLCRYLAHCRIHRAGIQVHEGGMNGAGKPFSGKISGKGRHTVPWHAVQSIGREVDFRINPCLQKKRALFSQTTPGNMGT